MEVIKPPLEDYLSAHSFYNAEFLKWKPTSHMQITKNLLSQIPHYVMYNVIFLQDNRL
jgi:hypothetical protein